LIYSRIKAKKIQAVILFWTLLLLFFSAITTLSYTYINNKKSILRQSEDFIKETSKGFVKDTMDYFLEVEKLAKILAPLFKEEDFTNNVNHPKIFSLLETVNLYPQITSLYFGYDTGYFLAVFMTQKGAQFRTSDNLLPSSIISALRIIKEKGDRLIEEWYYFNNEEEQIRSEIVEATTYDPRDRSWYKAASKSLNTEWSDVYVFIGSIKEPGITVSYPILLNKNATLKGVIAVDISIKNLSKFLASNKFTPNLKSYIINDKQEIIATSDPINNIVFGNNDFKVLSINEMGDCILKYTDQLYREKNKSENIIKFEYKNVDYYAVYTDFPSTFMKNWKIVLIYPLDDFIKEIKENNKESLLISLLILIFSSFLMVLVARRISRPIIQLSKEAEKIREFKLFDNISVQTSIKEIQTLAHSMENMKTSFGSFAKYVPHTLVSKLVRKNQSIQIGGKIKEITLLFTDITDFTSVSEPISADKVATYLSDYFDELTKIIMHTEGTIDKYIGDSIMAFWGAPIPDKNNSFNACLAALLCQKKLIEINALWHHDHKPVFKTRFGIHTGEAVVGNIGSSERMNYTAIGDNVNLCSRLEGLNKIYGTQIIISETVYDRVKNKFLTRPLDWVEVKGKTQPIKIFELIAKFDGDTALLPSEGQAEFCHQFEKAYNLFFNKGWIEALALFESLNDTHDKSVILYIERCKRLIADPPGQDWNGITHLQEK
jgi:adenylate cyclase